MLLASVPLARGCSKARSTSRAEKTLWLYYTVRANVAFDTLNQLFANVVVPYSWLPIRFPW